MSFEAFLLFKMVWAPPFCHHISYSFDFLWGVQWKVQKVTNLETPNQIQWFMPRMRNGFSVGNIAAYWLKIGAKDKMPWNYTMKWCPENESSEYPSCRRNTTIASFQQVFTSYFVVGCLLSVIQEASSKCSCQESATLLNTNISLSSAFVTHSLASIICRLWEYSKCSIKSPAHIGFNKYVLPSWCHNHIPTNITPMYSIKTSDNCVVSKYLQKICSFQ